MALSVGLGLIGYGHDLDVESPLVPTVADAHPVAAAPIAQAESPPTPSPSEVGRATGIDASGPKSPALPEAKPPPKPEPVEAPAKVEPKPPPPATPRGRAERYVEQMMDAAEVSPAAATTITDAFGRPVGETEFQGETKTKLPLRLSAIVDPEGGAAFAIVEDKQTGVVASYREGGVLWPGVLPGVWVIDVEPGVVHLLDLERKAFEYLTFTKAPPRKASRRSRRSTRKRTRPRRRRR